MSNLLNSRLFADFLTLANQYLQLKIKIAKFELEKLQQEELYAEEVCQHIDKLIEEMRWHFPPIAHRTKVIKDLRYLKRYFGEEDNDII